MQFIQNSSEIVKKKNSVVQYIQTMYVNVHKNAQILLYSEHTPVEDVGRKLQLLGHDPIHFLSTHNKLNNSISLGYFFSGGRNFRSRLVYHRRPIFYSGCPQP